MGKYARYKVHADHGNIVEEYKDWKTAIDRYRSLDKPKTLIGIEGCTECPRVIYSQ